MPTSERRAACSVFAGRLGDEDLDAVESVCMHARHTYEQAHAYTHARTHAHAHARTRTHAYTHAPTRARAHTPEDLAKTAWRSGAAVVLEAVYL